MKRPLFAVGLVIATCCLVALGVWQLQRLAWKLDLIEQVTARVHGVPQALPPWSDVGPDDAYLRVRVRGVFLHEKNTFVQALTEQGAGWWVLTPLRTVDGMVLVNRGFVPTERRADIDQGVEPGREETVTGLLRMSERGGGFLRANDPAADRWFSRDIESIAARRDLAHAAPFFIDADAPPTPGIYPASGLTVVTFRNPHLVYALTWFALAGLCLFGLWLLRGRAIDHVQDRQT